MVDFGNQDAITADGLDELNAFRSRYLAYLAEFLPENVFPDLKPIPAHGLELRREKVRELFLHGMTYKDIVGTMKEERGYELVRWEDVKRDINKYLRPGGYLPPKK